jgi:hypothetical protein
VNNASNNCNDENKTPNDEDHDYMNDSELEECEDDNDDDYDFIED